MKRLTVYRTRAVFFKCIEVGLGAITFVTRKTI